MDPEMVPARAVEGVSQCLHCLADPDKTPSLQLCNMFHSNTLLLKEADWKNPRSVFFNDNEGHWPFVKESDTLY